MAEQPHRRLNPLIGEWVLVSPHRAKRPWQGQVEHRAPEVSVSYDPKCYLCPGNERAGGLHNPAYTSTFSFVNDFATLKPDGEAFRHDPSGRGLLLAEAERGLCKVICFSPKHDLTLGRMTAAEILPVVELWGKEYTEIGARPDIDYVQIFENRGAMMGCSNPHPHCQIWASETLPNELVKEQNSQQRYTAEHGSCMLCDYTAIECEQGDRIVCENEHFVALVPFWAVWPFEVLLVSRGHLRDIASLNPEQQSALADILRRLTTRYDNLFEISFPYSMGMHQAPTDGKPHPEWHLHAHFIPPLLRSATVRKFMVGYELLATPQRDITAETAAERLRALSEDHYSRRV